ncbi:hypothetical protein C8J56DRAFT_798931 [Mycena floridula]|nr:hypothetical protein C8J56DRAFT_798931 [Mycena floridula]
MCYTFCPPCIDISFDDAEPTWKEFLWTKRLYVLRSSSNNIVQHRLDPPDDVLHAILQGYSNRKLSRAVKLERLSIDHGLQIGKSMLNRLEARLKISTVRQNLPPAEISRQAVVDEVAKDITQGNGPGYVTGKLATKGMVLPRDMVRKIMHEEFPSGFDKRYPGKSKPSIKRSTLRAIGPFHEICSDGHEKIGKQGLQMGNVGLPIYGYKDKWTGVCVKMMVIPDCRSAGAIGHQYLDLIEEIGGIPLQATTDKGSEVGWQFSIQCALRYSYVIFDLAQFKFPNSEKYAPDVDPDVYPAAVQVKSVHDTIIEGFWHWFRDKSGHNIKEMLLYGKHEHIFDERIDFHTDLFHWLFPTIVQREVDEFRHWWNEHRVRPQPGKEMPSGHIPSDAMEHPELLAGKSCLISVPKEAVQDLRVLLTEEVGAKENFTRWVSDEFQALADAAYVEIGSPSITFDNSWDVFKLMAAYLEDVLFA